MDGHGPDAPSPTPSGPRSRQSLQPSSPAHGPILQPITTDEVRPPPIRHSTGPEGYPPRPDPEPRPTAKAAPAVTGSEPRVVAPATQPIGAPPSNRSDAVVTNPVFDDAEGPDHESVLGGVDRFDAENAPAERGSDARSPRSNRTYWAMAAAVLVIAVGIFAVSRLDFGPDSAAGGPSVDQLARSTVQIVGLDGRNQPLCSGSGTIVSADGMILTNAHVITPDAVCNFVSLGIAVTTDSGLAPDLAYGAEVLAIDTELDLAVITVGRPLAAGTGPRPEFPAMTLGDSDELHIGDSLRIFGYPEIGGETITFTNGSVSGFTAQAGIGDRALIKTDATIAGGNSGGSAVDASGRLIGIPTKARASESGPAVDCRPLADTNNDGEVDDKDNCVPIGGFLNGLRPINLAKPLIDQAANATPQPLEPIRAEVTVDLADVTMSRPRFSLGEADNAPVQVIRTAAGGITELCLFVDWEGIPNGAEWDGLWYHEQELIEDFSLVRQSWEFGESGNNFWMCAKDSDDGLEPGLYELGFFLTGELVFAEGIVLTDEPAAVFATTWENTTELDICALAVNPVGSGPVGLNELDPGTRILPGESVAIDLPEGRAVVEAYDCDGHVVADSGGDGLEIVEERVYFIEAPDADDPDGDVSDDPGESAVSTDE